MHGEQSGQTCLYAACEKGNLEMAKLLAETGGKELVEAQMAVSNRERIMFITHLKPLQPKTAITDDLVW